MNHNDGKQPIELLASPWASTFYDFVMTAEQDLLITSPFLGKGPLTRLCKMFLGKPNLRLHIMTNLAVDSLLTGSLDIDGLISLMHSAPNSKVTYLPSLHAKVYIADGKSAIVTSANLTDNGLFGNREYGVLILDPIYVARVRNDLTKYSLLGNIVSLETLVTLSNAARDLIVQRKNVDKSVNAKLRELFEQRTEQAKEELLRARAKGKTTHGILCDTILYLLEKHGSLATTELHPLIQQIHPDLCDDSIDRVIDGVHFGKRWKHYVRNAQQALKSHKQIAKNGTRWYLRK